MIHVSEESPSSLSHSGWSCCAVADGSINSLTLYATFLKSRYNTEHCQVHLLTPYWQMLMWSWLMTGHLHYSQQRFQLHLCCMIVKGMCCLTELYGKLSPSEDFLDDCSTCADYSSTRLVARLPVILLPVPSSTWGDTPTFAAMQSCGYSGMFAYYA